MTELRRKMIEDMRLHGLAPSTQQVYVDEQYLNATCFGTETGTPESISRGSVYLHEVSKIAVSTMLLVNGANRMVTDGTPPIQ